MNIPQSLQDRRVQYAILAVGVIAVLVVLFMFVLRGSNPPPTDVAVGPYGDMPGGMPGGPPMPGPPGAVPGADPFAAPGVTGMPGEYGAPGVGMGQAAQPAATKKAGPKPPRRGDPFRALVQDVDEANNYTAQQQRQEPPLSDQLLALGVQRPELYQTIRARNAQEEYLESVGRGTVDVGDPPMRMAGVIHGPRISAVLDIGGESRVVRPGETVGPYRVERVERERIVLTRPLPGGRRRRVDVPLQAAPYLSEQYQGQGQFPGQPGSDMGAPPGAFGPGGFGPGGPPGLSGPGAGGLAR